MSERLNAEFGIGELLRIEKQNGLLCGIVDTQLCSARFYLHGAHVASFQPAGQREMLFMSGKSHYSNGKPIRGGVPICFPWFGPHQSNPDAPAHGLVRTECWKIERTTNTHDGVEVVLAKQLDPWAVRFRMLFTKSLKVELLVTNTSTEAAEFEVALHSYFAVSDVRQVEVTGLETVAHLDKLTGQEISGSGQAIQFTQETDRIYRPTDHVVTISDPDWQRSIVVEKSGSLSTVVWNPWIAKAANMPDFGDDEWTGMCCVETASVRPHQTHVAPGETKSVAATHRIQNG